MQASAIHGDVVLSASSSLSSEEAELRKRAAQRLLRKFDEEDAARERAAAALRRKREEEQRELAEYLKTVRRRCRRSEVLIGLVGAVAITIAYTAQSGIATVIWLIMMGVIMYYSWWPRWKVLRDAHVGRTITVPLDRKKW
ncbi:hypothetical protein [Streptomyces boncukensis]|uniref:Uncharacterized protein n=1 Tax=Streptomyces boncukensis TaxID=2711219 RepID=A0A6G4WQZ7_9ACTN|nr:hypothetical protein [Streptomyces boncukensis]NGO67625.1 hypothetical protein [Streptomyces boncukensis]